MQGAARNDMWYRGSASDVPDLGVAWRSGNEGGYMAWCAHKGKIVRAPAV